MCGIVAFSGKSEPGKREQFIELCRQSRIRGVHAFGVSYPVTFLGDPCLVTHKGLNFDDVMAAIPDPLPAKIIFHNRYSTSGDYTELENNQPIVNGRHALVFNGTIDMGTKAEMEARHGITMQTENDGEIVLQDIIAGDPTKHLGGGATFAGVYLNADGTMFALRNELRPLWCATLGDDKWLASTADIASRAKFDKNYLKIVPPNEIMYL